MGFFANPKEMFEHRANRFEQDGKRHWVKAKNGEGSYHYGKAKECFDRAAEAREKAKTVSSSPFSKKK